MYTCEGLGNLSKPTFHSSSWKQVLLYNFSSDLEGCHPVRIPSDLFVPIFLLTRDRLSVLKQSIESYQHILKTPFEIIILDHNSSYPPTLKYLHNLRQDKNNYITVETLKAPTWTGALQECNEIIGHYLRNHIYVDYYVFSDPDIALLRSRSDILLFLAANLASCPQYNQVGPGLQISDIPKNYTTKVEGGKTVYDQHKRFWNGVPRSEPD